MNPRAIQPPGARYDRGWYVERPSEEQRALRDVEFGLPVLLWGPRRQGRTWLWNHIAATWKAEDPEHRRVAVVDFRGFETSAFDSIDTCLRRVAVDIAEALDAGGDRDAAVAAAWDALGDAKKKMNTFMGRQVLPSLPGPLLLVLDHADLVHRCSYYNELAGMLRAWAERARDRAPWDRLRLLVSVSTHPARLSTEVHQSPFANLSDPILVGDLERRQVEKLAALHGVSFTADDIDRLIALVGGQPYLVRAVLVDIIDGCYTLAELAAGDFLGPSVLSDHLERHRARLAASPELAEAFSSLAVNPAAAISPDTLDSLIRQGLVRQGVGRTYPVRYAIYERLLSDAPAASVSRRKLRVVYSYAPRDESLRERLGVHLKLLERQGFIEPWHDRRIPAAGEKASPVDRHIKEADIVLLLVSADLLASDYCWNAEMKLAMERHEAGKATVVPILLRPCDWSSAPFATLAALPKDGIPVTRWTDPEDAWAEIAQGIRQIVTDRA
jgi:hypothetical protein